MKSYKIKTITIVFIIFVTSCVPIEKVSYFNDIDNLQEPTSNPKVQKPITSFDKLYIRVLSIDPQTSQIFNSTEEMRSGGGQGGNSIIGYIVDEKGNINFPFVGEINVAGLITSQAALKIQKLLSDYVSNTSVVVKYIDNQVTILGEVNQQGVRLFAEDKINIYEALALGGGITKYGDRKKVILLRQEGEKVVHYRLNLSDSKIAFKDNYYILPNDVIIVEPLKAVSTSYANMTYSNILATLSVLIAIILLGYTIK
jgi:polysaccharide export outer membrane protein